MPTTATGNFAATLYNLETLVCGSSTFQTAVGAADAAAARAFVYWLASSPPSADTTKPWVWLKLKESWEARAESSGGGGFWHRMPLMLFVQRPDATGDLSDVKERQIKFWNFVGSFIADMEALAKTSGYLWVTGFTLVDHVLSDPKESYAYQQAMFDVQVY